MSLQFSSITFAFEGQKAIFNNLNLSFSKGWTGVLGANGAGKTSLLHLAMGLLCPQKGSILGASDCLYLSQRVDSPPEQLGDLTQITDGNAAKLCGLLQIGADWNSRWESLSPGEKKRAQAACALWTPPSVLLLDEPSNHLDLETKQILLPIFKQFKGVGILVSHDHSWLENLCSNLVWLEPDSKPLWAPNLEQLEEAQTQKKTSQKNEYNKVQSELNNLQQQSSHYRDLASRSHQLRSKRHIAKKDHDAKAKINAARVTGRDGTAGKLLNQLQGRAEQMGEKLQGIKIKRDYRGEISQGGERAKSNLLLQLPPGRLKMGDDVSLQYPQLEITPKDRIGIVGPNGAGKSTLLNFIVSKLDLPPNRVLTLPQEVTLEGNQEVVRQLKSTAQTEKGKLLSLVGRLGSDPKALLQSEFPSPGETRKLLIAKGLLLDPWLIVLDEPTNHLDLPSILALEQALALSPVALLLVSHDQNFLDRLCNQFWKINGGSLTVEGA